MWCNLRKLVGFWQFFDNTIMSHVNVIVEIQSQVLYHLQFCKEKLNSIQFCILWYPTGFSTSHHKEVLHSNEWYIHTYYKWEKESVSKKKSSKHSKMLKFIYITCTQIFVPQIGWITFTFIICSISHPSPFGLERVKNYF